MLSSDEKQSTPTMILTNDKDDSSVFPDLPLVCLSTAKDLTTHEVVKGKNVVIDFWTTRCTRCPKALDRLDRLAVEEKEKHNIVNGNHNDDKVTFVSICCDKLDGAREIIEKDEQLKWPNVQHYYMDPESKEIAKSVLGFLSVPFYVMVNAQGEMTQKGNKVDWTQLPSSKSSSVASSVCKTLDAPSLDQENQPVQPAAPSSNAKFEKESTPVMLAKELVEEQTFVLDGLDF